VIEVRGLRKVYRRAGRGRRIALDGLDLEVGPGQVHGFLGPNGSGKTTTIRALLGLLGYDSGHVRVLGHPVPESLPKVISRVGALVESPSFFPNFTAEFALSLLADAGDLDHARVHEVLDRVGLRDRGRDRVRTYSLGMKQRLAVAAALLRRPTLLILDEPANGLDPGGIRAMRDLVQLLAADGMTILFSSHILSEVEQICDAVTIISRGRRIVAGPVSEVLASHARVNLRVRVDADLILGEDVLRAAGADVTRVGDQLIVSNVDDPAWVTRTLVAKDIFVRELSPVHSDLETVFLDLTQSATAHGWLGQLGDAERADRTVPRAHTTGERYGPVAG
jgi:ABC-2 type transport system ATP-binding protein